jgi:hypothetical protein
LGLSIHPDICGQPPNRFCPCLGHPKIRCLPPITNLAGPPRIVETDQLSRVISAGWFLRNDSLS